MACTMTAYWRVCGHPKMRSRVALTLVNLLDIRASKNSAIMALASYRCWGGAR